VVGDSPARAAEQAPLYKAKRQVAGVSDAAWCRHSSERWNPF